MKRTDEKLLKKEYRDWPNTLDVTSWEPVKAAYESLLSEEIHSADELVKFIEKASELDQMIGDEFSWRYIRMTLHADDESYEEKFNQYNAEVHSQASPYRFMIQKKFYESPYRQELTSPEYAHLNKMIANEIELYREENIPLQVKEAELANKYGALFGKMTVQYKGEEKTMIQIGVFQKNPDRAVREETWRLRMERMEQSRDEFDRIFDELKEVRIQIAKNAGFDNYRDYMHQAMGRFSYTPEELYQFHDAVSKAVVPFLQELQVERKEKLHLEKLRPWDTQVDLDGKILHPFETVEEFVDKAIDILDAVNPAYGIQLNKMYNTGLLDLENRKGKAPGGYNCSINELNSSFIFMNSVKLHRDVVTLLHEAGHAMHSAAMATIRNSYFTSTPSEVAELASMSMELLTMENWKLYYPNEEDFKKAKREQLEGTLSFLPWCMIVDAFQHWIYLNPNHTAEERREYFAKLSNRFETGIDWSGLENYFKLGWMFQLHIFEVPFYYIEYGMAQLGALAVYKNYKENGKKAIEAYQHFLETGYRLPVRNVYEAAGIRFDFSEQNLRELVDFVKAELKEI